MPADALSPSPASPTPPPSVGRVDAANPGLADEDEEAPPGAEGPLASASGSPGVWPGLWVDRASFAIRGMDSAAGVRTRLGPGVIFSGVRVPAWLYIQEPGQEAVRLHVLGVSVATPAPGAFDTEWLISPESPPTEDSASLDPPPEVFPRPSASDQKP
jgi:hypothetical protein